MKLDLTGINNCNEYFTSHYFNSIFPNTAFDSIKGMTEGMENLPWKLLRGVGKQYSVTSERLQKASNSHAARPSIKSLADGILSSLGYGEANPSLAEANDGSKIPVYLEVKKINGAPLLWAILVECTEEILKGSSFEGAKLDGFEEPYTPDFDNESLVTKAFFGMDEPPRWVMLIGGSGVVLLDRNKWSQKRYLEFDLDEIYSRKEETTFIAMTALLGKDSLCPNEGANILDSFEDESQRNASGVSTDLKYALRESIELLGNEVLYDFKVNKGRDLENDPIDAGELTLQCLRYMYRMLFVFFIEARPELGYAPMKSEVYMKGYSLEHLRDIADLAREDTQSIGDGYYLDNAIKKLFDLIYNGYHPVSESSGEDDSVHDAFRVEPLKAHIFDPELTSMITNAKIRNTVMLRILNLMSTSRGDGKSGKGRISYSALGINQMGSVYEALLSYRGFIAEEDLYEVKRADDQFDELEVGYFVSENDLEKYDEAERVRYQFGPNKGKLHMYPKGSFIYRLAGREREKSASYYTPECLTKCLVKYALKELLKDKTADQILDLKICEPAMGSAAFLNESINQLAEAYIERKEKELGQQIPFDQRFAETQKVKMYIADRNVYGIDLNPTAVELAEVSLWLNTICEGGYVPWFGMQIMNGNSLVGARKQVYSRDAVISNHPAVIWYNNAPKTVPYGSKRTDLGSVYHFLLGDPGMCEYNDKVIRDLDPDNIAKMKKWRTTFCKPWGGISLATLQHLSKVIDDLWTEQVLFIKKINQETADRLDVFGREDRGNHRHTSIKQKDETLHRIYKSEHQDNAGCYARLKFAMDYWCALWFWPIDKADLLPSRDEFLLDMTWILEGTKDHVAPVFGIDTKKGRWTSDGSGVQLNLFDFMDGEDEQEPETEELGIVDIDMLCDVSERLALVRKIAQENHFFHWDLEFADIFHDKGGFDLIVGNPPWINLEWIEEDVLSDFNPLFTIKKSSVSDIVAARNDTLSSDPFRNAYFAEYVSIAGEQSFLSGKQNYPDLIGQRTNLYKCFLPQAWSFSSKTGVSGFVHPDGVYDDPRGGTLRRVLYPRLRYHFQFQNEKKLFSDVANRAVYSLNVYSNAINEEFDSISNLFIPSTIDECYGYVDDGKPSGGIKDASGDWNTKGHSDRIIKTTREELLLYAALFDNSEKWEQARLPVLHSSTYLSIFRRFASQKRHVSDLGNGVFGTTCWNETNAQKEGLIVRDVHFPFSADDAIYSGPHVGVGNPLFQTSQRNCSTHRAFDVVDLTRIASNYRPRCNYSEKASPAIIESRMPTTGWGTKYSATYKVVSREMANLAGERTVISAIYPPKVSHIYTLFGVCFEDITQVPLLNGSLCSLPYDFYFKATGKGHINGDTINGYPLLDKTAYSDEIALRSLLLNCLTDDYRVLWEKCWKESFKDMGWSKTNERLSMTRFTSLKKDFSPSFALRTDFERRQALVELDVLVALSLGMTLDQLISAYRIQFPVLQLYESDTWYDSKGRIVFTANRGLSNVGLQRPDWDRVRDNKYPQTITIDDDTLPDGPIKKEITYYPPYDFCDREQDYRTAWEFFSKKYGGADK